MFELKIEEELINLALEENPIKFIVSTEGARGEKGIQGVPGISGLFNKVCGEDIGGNRVVIIDVDGKLYYADKDNLNHINKILGITTQAGMIGTTIQVQSISEMVEPSWNWDVTKPAVYLGNNGLLTQTVPITGFLLEIGNTSSNISIIINIKMAFILN